ncbi:MAG: hypothetical protein FWC73_03445 [Defluviitaleaceae bacterium]|nr:hypothetical protein [Defluviitaleaceae bacterium]
MKVLFDETYPSKDGKETSRNLWYGYADFSAQHEYGKIITLNEDMIQSLCGIIKNDLTMASSTETNWYFYGDYVSKDAIGDSIRPTIMIREKAGKFTVNFSISDYDFAVNIDAILEYKADLERHLTDS